jgi:hypothetical protein
MNGQRVRLASFGLPIGPTDVVLLEIIYAPGFAVKKLALLFRPKSPV